MASELSIERLILRYRDPGREQQSRDAGPSVTIARHHHYSKFTLTTVT